MLTENPSIYVVHDDLPTLRALCQTLRSAEYSVEAFASPQEFFDRKLAEAPGCVVASMHMKGIHGLEFMRFTQARTSSMPTIFVTDCGEIPCAVRAIKAGAVDVLVNPHFAELPKAVEEAVARHAKHLAERQEQDKYERKYRMLTPKEREVCMRVRRGLLNKQIAWELAASEKTVKLHRSRVMRKLEVESVPALVDFLRHIGGDYGGGEAGVSARRIGSYA
jgi:FixJ family two-component response regulator